MGYTEKIYYGLSSIIIILYILAYFGVYESKDDLAELNFFFRFFIGAMLVYIFNPYIQSSKKIDKTHQYMAFSGGAAILAMLGLSKISSHIKKLVSSPLVHRLSSFSRLS